MRNGRETSDKLVQIFDLLKNAGYAIADASRFDRLLLLLVKRDHLRILTYHGICPDQYADAGWVPTSFVTVSQFKAQMKLLAMHMTPVRLSAAVDMIRRGDRLPDGSVAVTFDDGYRNNMSLALPILKVFGIPITIFLSTNYIGSDRSDQLFPFDKLRLLRFWEGQDRREGDGTSSVPPYKRSTIEAITNWLEANWSVSERLLTQTQREVLEPLSWDVISSENSGLIDFGAHTHRHAILANETVATRRQEIACSIDMVATRTGSRQIPFSYPNGTRQDFDHTDKRTVEACGAICAATQISGANPPGADLFELRRYPVGLFHTQSVFLAELCGLRSGIRRLALTRRKQPRAGGQSERMPRARYDSSNGTRG